MKTWLETAKYCEETYGSYVDWHEQYFICPECEEPIYESDWEEYEFSSCPICNFDFFYGES